MTSAPLEGSSPGSWAAYIRGGFREDPSDFGGRCRDRTPLGSRVDTAVILPGKQSVPVVLSVLDVQQCNG